MKRIAIISPFPPAIGGMAVLAQTLYKNLVQQGFDVIPINTNPEVRSWVRVEILLKIKQWFIFLFELRMLRKCKAAIVISSSGDFFYTKALLVLIIGKVFRCRVILDFVGGGIMQFTDKEKKKIFKKIKKFDLVVVPSSPFKEIFEKEGVECTLFPHIVEIERFWPSKAEIKEPVFISAKNLEEYSNIGSIIRAFAIIKEKFPAARLLITGDGPQKSYLKSLVKDLSVSNVEFLEGLSNEEMPGVYRRASIFLHATKIESFGIALVEALASGVPVVSTNVGGIPDIIKDEVNGYLIEFDDHTAMAERVIKLLEDRNLHAQFVEEGLKTAKQYSGSVLAPKIAALINHLTEK